MEKSKEQSKRRRKARPNRKTGFYYSFFTIILLFCLIQIGYGAILNVGKIISYKGKIVTLEHEQQKAEQYNQDLKTEKKVITSDNSIEEIARNNLKLAQEDEILVIINKKVEEPTKTKQRKNYFSEVFKNLKKEKKDNKESVQLNIPTEFGDE